MTWNPLKRNSLNCRPSPAPPVISRAEELELEQTFTRLQNLEDATKKLLKEMKKYLESVTAAGKSEQKITADLSASYLCHNDARVRQLVEDYHTVTSQVFGGVQELLRNLQHTCQEPLKFYKNQFVSIDAAFHRREQLVQEWRNITIRLKKLDDRERTAGNIVKIERERKALQLATKELADFHSVLLTDATLFFSKRGDYFSPTLQALIQSQLDFHGNTTRLFTQLLPHSAKTKGTPTSALIPEEEYQASVQEKLSKIRALSIVKP